MAGNLELLGSVLAAAKDGGAPRSSAICPPVSPPSTAGWTR